jgi:universal stress protein E
MKPIRRILFAIRDPAARRQTGLAKAITLTQSLGASLELFHALASPVFAGLHPLTGESIEDLRRDLLARTRKRLEGIAAAGRARGVDITCHADWDYPAHEAILRRADRAGADLIIAERHKGPHRRPWLMQLTDWELLRASERPVLLLGSAAPYDKPVVLAAVDPTHSHAKPLDLDRRILEAADLLSDALGGRLHAMHASHVTTMPVASLEPTLDPVVFARQLDELRKLDRELFARLMQSTDIPKARRHLVSGLPSLLIPELSRQLSAAIVVMGAVSRSAVKRLFIGATAERVLDALACDVLVVKPGTFRSRVPVRSRGMHVVSPMPLGPMP